jgi:hypothetical protein
LSCCLFNEASGAFFRDQATYSFNSTQLRCLTNDFTSAGLAQVYGVQCGRHHSTVAMFRISPQIRRTPYLTQAENAMSVLSDVAVAIVHQGILGLSVRQSGT